MTQADLAKGLFDRSYISQIESGVIVPPLSTLKLLSERLHVPLSDLVDTDHSEKATLVRHGKKLLSESSRVATPDQLYLAWELFMEGQAAVSELLNVARDFLRAEQTTERTLYVLQRTVLRIIQSEDIREDHLAFLIQLGNAYFTLSRYLDALAVYETVLEFRPNAATRLRTLVNMGSTLYLLNRHEQAHDCYTMALELAEQTHRVEMIARCHHGLGIVYRSMGDLKTAYNHTLTSVELYQGIDEIRRYGAKQNMGVILRELGHNPLAESYFKECLEVYLSSNDYALVASVLEELAHLNVALGLLNEALMLCNNSIDYIYQTNDAKQLTRLLYLKTDIHTRLGQWSQANDSKKMATFMVNALHIVLTD